MIEGIGPTSLDPQVGIWISFGATGLVSGNRISGHNYLEDRLNKSFGILAIDWQYSVGMVQQPRPLLSVRYENNTLTGNQWAIASILSPGSEFVNNYVEGPSPRASTGFGITGATNRLESNTFVRVTRGIVLMGDDPEYGTKLGKALGPVLLDNRFCDVGTNIAAQPLVTEVSETGSLTCPFPAPSLVIEPAVVLTWPAFETGLGIEAAPALTGPWAPLDTPVTNRGNAASATVASSADARYFRLRKP